MNGVQRDCRAGAFWRMRKNPHSNLQLQNTLGGLLATMIIHRGKLETKVCSADLRRLLRIPWIAVLVSRPTAIRACNLIASEKFWGSVKHNCRSSYCFNMCLTVLS